MHDTTIIITVINYGYRKYVFSLDRVSLIFKSNCKLSTFKVSPANPISLVLFPEFVKGLRLQS